MKVYRAACGRWLVVFVALVTAPACWLFTRSFGATAFDFRSVLLAAVFVALYVWICSWVFLAGAGTWHLWRARFIIGDCPRPPSVSRPQVPRSSTAVVIPVCNEDPEAVFARTQAMIESVAATGAGRYFDFFVLSDSSDPDIWLREECCWAALRTARGEPPVAYYRRRPNNFRRKTGNIADFCERWGSRYRYMIVLDADSIIDGATMIELVSRMDSAPRIGILQVPCLPALSRSLYARVQQFAASAYGPVLFAGLSYCLQDNGVFWGHNAIIRIEAFIEHCGLPALSGRPPFGGPILSHDFVEGAFMRRAGYAVRLAWDIVAGSYEQCPESVPAAAARDRRWCQGNLQHLRLVLSNTFTVKSRVHFVTGALSYLMSLVWCVFVVLYATDRSRDAAAHTWQHGSIPVIALTMILLVAPKACGLLWMEIDQHRAAFHGGRVKAALSSALETGITLLVAPISMLTHVACVVSVLLGAWVDWTPAHRRDSSSPWRDALRTCGWQTPIGAALALAAFHEGAYTALWLSPVWLPLIFAVPIAAVTSSRLLGEKLRDYGFLLAPSEVRPDAVLRRTYELMSAARALAAMSAEERFWHVVRDPWLNALHVSLLRSTGARSRPHTAIESLLARVRSGGITALASSEVLALLSDIRAMQCLHEAAAAGGTARYA